MPDLKKNKLRNGYSTGTCVTIAAKAAALQLFDDFIESPIGVQIPTGDYVEFDVYNLFRDGDVASASVTKDGGDDPDDTHGLEIGCRVRLIEKVGVTFRRGVGIGLVTLPGLSLEVGEAAINPTPREEITKMLYKLAFKYDYLGGFEVEPFVPEGEEVAKKTFNPRVGIIGGISIIGTTGVVKPYSSDAFVASIEQGLNLLKVNGGEHVVLNSGGRSEKFVRLKYPNLDTYSFIQYGNFIGETLKIIREKGFSRVSLCIMLGKAVKLAEGHLDTHSHKVRFSPEWLADIACQSGYAKEVCNQIRKVKLAGQVPNIIPMNSTEAFYQDIIELCYSRCKNIIKYTDLEVILVSKGGDLIEKKI